MDRSMKEICKAKPGTDMMILFVGCSQCAAFKSAVRMQIHGVTSLPGMKEKIMFLDVINP